VQSFPSVIDLALCTVLFFCYRLWTVYSLLLLLWTLPCVKSCWPVTDISLCAVHFQYTHSLPDSKLFSCWFSPKYRNPFFLHLTSLFSSLQMKAKLGYWKSRSVWPDMLKLTIQRKLTWKQCTWQFQTTSLSPALHRANVPSVVSLLALFCVFHQILTAVLERWRQVLCLSSPMLGERRQCS